MNLVVTTCIVLLVILASMHYLAKVKSENLGPFFKWIGYLVLLAATLLLLGMLFRGVKKVTHYGRGHGNNAMHMQQGMQGERAKKRSRHKTMHFEGRGASGCEHHNGRMDMCCCSDGEMGGVDMDDCCHETVSESSVDTIDGKIIKKEIEIIRKEKEKQP